MQERYTKQAENVLALAKEAARSCGHSYIGTEHLLVGLVEEKEGLTNRYRGRSKADAPDEVDGQVIFRCDEDLDIGSFVQVKITDAKEYDLFGIWKES